jgi:uncharacterized membrane protein
MAASSFQMGAEGIEPPDASALPTNDLQQSRQSGAAKSGAVSVDAIIAMLAALSPEDRARLAALLSGQAEGEDRK